MRSSRSPFTNRGAERYRDAVAIRDPIIRRLGWSALALGLIVTYGVAGYMLLERWSFVDALYMTTTALTTVGFTEARPLDQGGRIFTVTLVVLGVGLALLTISLIATLVAEGELGAGRRRRRMDRSIEQLRDHYIVCAYGRVGRAVVRELKAMGAPFIVIDPLEDLRTRLEADGILFMIEDPSLEPVLRHAGVDRARGLVCAVDSDATNVYITLMARSLNADLLIVARASEPGSPERLQRAGADRVVSPFVTSGRHMARMAADPGLVDVLELGSRPRSIDVEERAIEPGSELDGSTVADAPGPVLAIRRAGGAVTTTPEPTSTLAGGDVILLLRN
jgi:voltage-gated potassium channel